MTDFWSQTPNFSNPDYASPEQLAQQRRYAEELQKRSGQEVKRPTGALANMIDALTAGLTRNNANQIQSQAAQGNAADVARLAAQLQGGQPLDPQTQGHLAANPMASPEMRGLIGHLITPQQITSGLNQPGYTSPNAGVTAPPIRGQYQPATPVSQATEGTSMTGMQPTPNVQTAPLTPTNPQGGMYGGLNFRPAPAPPPGSGGPAAGAGLPPAPPPVGPNGAPAGFPGLDALAAKGRELKAKSEMAQGQSGTMKEDYAASQAAPAIKRIAGIMANDIQASGNNMNFGPTAETHTNIKKAIANYFPGTFSKEQIDGLASQDSFEKSAAQLANMLTAKASGTDAQLLNNIHSVPGAHNSKEGAQALLKMTQDVADQQVALRQATAGRVGDAYEQARKAFFADPNNRIKNPITGNPIEQDMTTQKASSGSYEKTATNPTTGARMGLKNGKWEPIP